METNLKSGDWVFIETDGFDWQFQLYRNRPYKVLKYTYDTTNIWLDVFNERHEIITLGTYWFVKFPSNLIGKMIRKKIDESKV